MKNYSSQGFPFVSVFPQFTFHLLVWHKLYSIFKNKHNKNKSMWYHTQFCKAKTVRVSFIFIEWISNNFNISVQGLEFVLPLIMRGQYKTDIKIYLTQCSAVSVPVMWGTLAQHLRLPPPPPPPAIPSSLILTDNNNDDNNNNDNNNNNNNNNNNFFFFFFFFCVPQLYLWGSPLLGEIFAYVTVF